MLGEVHEAMTNVDEGDEHQMERRLYGRRRLEKVHLTLCLFAAR